MLKLLIATVLIALTFAAKDSFKDYSLRKVGKVKLRIDKQRLNRYNEFKLWSDFKRKHGKTYTDDMEDSNRFAIFHQNHRMVNQHNQGFRDGLHTFEMEINQFGDMTNEEFTSTMNGFKRSYGDSLAKGHGSTFLEPFNVTYPHKMDWRTHGYVTPVKNQGQCGSCWSFSATGSLEGQHMRKTGKLVSLSEQNLVDCSRQYGNNGCEGGLMDQAFQYIKANGGIDTEGSYPYVAKDDTCEFQESEVGAEDTGFMDIIPHGHENALKAAVATIGPVSVAIDASHPSFQFYKKGVYIEPQCSPGQLDHGVLVIGYGTTTDQQDYWIVKNSWGPTWGEQGYIRMARNRNNQCGVATQASYPLV